MPATFDIPLITVIPGQTITAALWNNEYGNIYDNFEPQGMDDYSANDSQMQTTVDPFPGGATSRPTSLQGEIERIRYQLVAILGETYWYNDPDATIANLHSRVTSLEAALTAPTGTKMVFYQAAAPTGWTAESVNDKFLRVVTSGGTGGTTGGTVAASTSLAHSHTVASHTHSISSDGTHTHSTPAHQHQLDYTLQNLDNTDGTVSPVISANTDGASIGTPSGVNFSNRRYIKNQTQNSGSGTSGSDGSHSHTGSTGAASPSTDSQLGAFAYADVIIASKN